MVAPNASFRGVPFHIKGSDTPIEKRTEISDFAYRDIGLGEEFGRNSRRFSFSAFVLGDDYLAQKAALIEALYKPGLGELRHPHFGIVNVMYVGGGVSVSSNEQNMASFNLEFAEVVLNLNDFVIDTNEVVFAKIEITQTAANKSLAEKFDTENAPSAVTENVVSRIEELNSQMDAALVQFRASGAKVSEFQRSAKKVLSGLQTIAKKPLEVALEIGDLLNSFKDLANAPRELLAPLKLLMQFGVSFKGSKANGVAGSRNTKNDAAISNFVQTYAAAITVAAISEIEFASKNEAESIRDEFSSLIDALAVKNADLGNFEIWAALNELTAAICADINTRAVDLPRIVNFIPNDVLPLAALNHRLYGAVDFENRMNDLFGRNNIQSPLFVASGTSLEVKID